MIADALLREPQALAERVRTEPSLAVLNARLAAAGVVGSALYGAAVGGYVGRIHVLLTAVKMPVFFLLTLAICFALMHVVVLAARVSATSASGGRADLTGAEGAVARPVRAAQTLAVALSGISLTAIVLGALSPVIAVFSVTASMPHYPTYLTLVLVNTLACGVAGVCGLGTLIQGLRRLAGSGPGTRRVLAVWLVLYPFVGAQVAWILRPWIGSSYDVPGLYSLKHGLTGNFYVAVWDAICLWLRSI